MDDQGIIEIYDKLPSLRRKVLDQILVGYDKAKIAMNLCEGSDLALKGHLKEIYKNFDDYFEKFFHRKIRPEDKIRCLIILFYREVPNLARKINITFGSKPVSQFGTLIRVSNQNKFTLNRISLGDISMLQNFGQIYFNSQDHLPKSLLESWYKQDSNNFRMMKNKNGDLVGFFIILFVKLLDFIEFAKGDILESDLTGHKIISSNQLQDRDENYLYISAIVGDPNATHTNICMILYFIKYIDLIRKHRKIEKLYATAATDSGRRLMQDHFNFTICTSSINRKDGEDFFELDISKMNTSLFTFFLDRYPHFERYISNIDFSNESDWKPIYA